MYLHPKEVLKYIMFREGDWGITDIYVTEQCPEDYCLMHLSCIDEDTDAVDACACNIRFGCPICDTDPPKSIVGFFNLLRFGKQG